METTEIILRESGNNIAFNTDDMLKETDMGEWERKHFHPDQLEVDMDQALLMLSDPFKFVGCPGGETFEDPISRCKAFL